MRATNRRQAVDHKLHRGDSLTVREAAEWICEQRGRRPSLSTVYRWMAKGVRGRRLASEFTGGVRLISTLSLDAFFRDSNESVSLAWDEAASGAFLHRHGAQANGTRFLKNQLLLPFPPEDA